MSVYLRRQVNSYIESSTDEPSFKKKPSSLSKLSPGGKILAVHQFQDAVNMIFRPKRHVHPNNFIRKNPSTDRNNLTQDQSHLTYKKPSSLENSLSLLKKIKDYIVPTNFSFFKFTKNSKSEVNTSNTSNSVNTGFNKIQPNLSNLSKLQQKHQGGFEQEKVNNEQQNDLISERSFTIPEVKVTLPRKISIDCSECSKISSRPLTDRTKNDKDIRKDLFNSRRSQVSQKSVCSKLSLNTEGKSSKITNPSLNILKSEHVEGQKLKFFYVLGHTLDTFSNHHSAIYTLVGNENELDCICMSKTQNHNIIDTDLAWTLTLAKGTNEKGKINSVTVEIIKSTIICMLSNDLKLIQIHRYNPKQLFERPQHLTNIYIFSPVHTFHILKQNHLILVYDSKLVEIYSIEGLNQAKKRFSKSLQSRISLKKNTGPLQILKVSEPFNQTVTVYMSCDISQSQNPLLFDLYIIEITYMGQGQTTMTKPHKVYSIKAQLKPSLRFDNLSTRFFLLYAGLQVLAVMKEGYMIDSAKVDVQQEKSLLKYIGKNRLLLITQSKIEQYQFILNEKSPPYRLLIKSLDSILLPPNYDPRQYEFFDIIPIFQSINTQKSLYQQIDFLSTYLICFQQKYRLNKKSVTGQVPYMLTVTRPVSIHQKAQKLFNFDGRDLSEVDIEEIQQKVDIAKKMGLKVRDIYLDLWNRTKKNSVQDFCFLLDTHDYETISKQIQKKLKKQAMLYTELTKIEASCLSLLRKKVYSSECTESDLKNYIISHFKLKKYDFFKDVSQFCENEMVLREQLKKPDPKVSKQHSSSDLIIKGTQKRLDEHQQRKLMFDIQAFYTYNQMQLKSYLLHLFHKYFYEIQEMPASTSKGNTARKSKDQMAQTGNFALVWAKKKDYLLKIKIMMNNFRFQLKIIYEELLQELIKLTQKGSTITELLEDFEQILPKSFSNEQAIDTSSIIEQEAYDNLKATKKFQISKLKSSSRQTTKGQLQLEGIWRAVTDGDYSNYLYLQNVETIYNKDIVQSLSRDLWFKRNFYSQHDFIFKNKGQIMEIDKKLKSSYIFYFFIDRVYEIIENQSVRKEVIQMLDQNYVSVLPKHLRGKVQLYYLLFLQTKKLSKQYAEKLHHQTMNASKFNTNPINTSTGQNESKFSVNQKFNSQQKLKNHQKIPLKKSLYETFLPPKQTHNPKDLDSFQNFLKLSQIQLFRQFIKLQYILVGCIFHRIKPIYEKFDKGKTIFNQTVSMYFESKTSQISHLKCLLNRLNSESKEFQQAHFQLYQVLLKSVMIKTQIGSQVPQQQYVNVDQFIIYVHGIYMANQHHFGKRTLQKSSQLLGININSNEKFVKLSEDQNLNQSRISGIIFNEDSPKTIQSKGSFETQSSTNVSIYFTMLYCISENQELFKKIKIRISLYEIYQLYKQNKTQKITTQIVKHLMKTQNLYQIKDYLTFQDKTVEILVHAALILNKLFMSKQNFIKQIYHMQQPFMTESAKTIDNLNYQNELFFILFWKIMSHEEFMFKGWVFRLLQNKDIVRNYLVNEMLKENFVIFMAKFRFSLDRLFVNNIKYLQCLINLLPEKNKIRKYFIAQIQLVKAIQPTLQPYHETQQNREPLSLHKLRPMIQNPLTQNSQIISIFHIQEILSLYPSQYLLKLDLEKIGTILNEMQQILLEVAVRQRLADKNIDSGKNVQKKEDISIQEHVQKKDDLFSKLEGQNSNSFIQTLQKSLHHNGISEHPHASILYCGTPLYSPVCETPIVMSNREIVISEIETLIKQSAQPYTFFNNSEVKLIRSFKLMKESRSFRNLNSRQKTESPQRHCEYKDAQISVDQLQNLSQYYTGLTEIYEVVIKRLINSEMVKEVIGYLQKILSLSQSQREKTNQLYIVYPLLILNIISRELSPQNKFLLIKICSHLFKEPAELLKFIKELVGQSKPSDKNNDKENRNTFKYSLNELNKKLADFEKTSSIYKIQYVPVLQQSDVQDQAQKEEASKIEAQTKKRLKKKLTIKIYDQDQISQKTFNINKLHSPPVQQFKQIQYLKRPFSYENPILSTQCINSIVSEEQKLSFVLEIWKMFDTMQKEKQLFSKNFEFMIMNVMLMQEPYTIVKYLETKLKGWHYSSRQLQLYGQTSNASSLSSTMLKFKSILSYFNIMIKQSIINPLRLLQFGKRMFYMLYSIIVERSSIEYQIREYYDIPLTQILPCNQFPEESPLSEAHTAKFQQSILAFSKKIKQLNKKMTPCGKFLNQNAQIESPHAINIPYIPKHQRKPSNHSISPKKSEGLSKENQQLLELSCNDIEEMPFLNHNPSIVSQNCNAQQIFDPSKERQLIKSRGYNRYSAILSTNLNDSQRNNLKDKLSPKSIRSSKAPSITISSSGQRFFGKHNNKFFAQKKQNLLSQKKAKKTYDKMIGCSLSEEEDIQYEQQDVIYEQDFQISQQVSQNDENKKHMILPPKLHDQVQFENMLESSTEQVNVVQNSRNLVVEDLNLKKNDQNDFIRWSYQQPKPQKKKFNFLSLKEQSQDFYTPQFEPNKQTGFEETQYAFKPLNKSDKSSENILSSKSIQNLRQVIMEEDESVQVQNKNQTGCQFLPEVVKSEEQLTENDPPFVQLQNKPKDNGQKMNHKKQNYTPDLKSQNVIIERSIEQRTQTKQPSNHIVQSNLIKGSTITAERKNNLKNSFQSQKKNQLSNQLKKLEKSLENESPPSVNSFRIQSKVDKKQNLVKLQRKQQKTQIKSQISEPLPTEKISNSAQVVKPNIRKNLTLQIQKQPESHYNKTETIKISKTIPKLLISPRNIPHSDPVKQNQLQRKIKNEMTKNGLEGFLLTELEEIYEKFREYWEKCEDMIQNNSPRNEFTETKSRNSSMINDKNTNLVANKSKKFIGAQSIPISHSDISLELSHSYQSFVQDTQSIELLSNQDPFNFKQPQTLFTKEELYNLMISMLQQKLKEKKQRIDTQIFLQEIKDKLFYNICMKRLVEWYTNQVNFNAIAKIIDIVFKKKIYITDYFYEVVSTKQVQRLEVLVEQLTEDNLHNSNRLSVKNSHHDIKFNKNEKINSPRMNNISKSRSPNIDSKALSPRSISVKKNTVHYLQTPQKTQEKALSEQSLKVQTLLQKIPLNILQFRKKQLMLKLKPGKQMGRKYLLDILVKVFGNKKDKRLGQQVYSRLKNLIDKEIK